MAEVISLKPKAAKSSHHPPLPAMPWLNALVRVRRSIRYLANRLEINRAIRADFQRSINKLQAENNPFNTHRIQGLVATMSELRESAQDLRNLLISMGEGLMRSAPHIDASVPQSTLVSFLEINIADQPQIEPEDGFSHLAFARGLESSAYHRGDDWKKGPFAVAMEMFMQHEMLHNEELSQQMQDYVFGPGGMFEFLPTYMENEKGEMVRQPPNLRLVKAEAA